MFRQILVPLDGSGRAEQALPVAARLARASGSSLVLVRVIDTSVEHQPTVPGKPALFEMVSEVDHRLAETYLQGIADKDTLRGVAIQIRTPFGLVAPTILDVARSEKADLIVLCSHGFTGVTNWVMGSIAEKVAHYAHIPVLILREGGSMLSNTNELRVLVPLDGSHFAEEAVAPAAALVCALTEKGSKANLHLLHVVKPVPLVKAKTGDTHSAHSHQANREMAEQYMETRVERLRNHALFPTSQDGQVEISWSVVVNNDIAQTIIKTAEHGAEKQNGPSHPVDMIAMTTHGYSGRQIWATGNVTGRVLHRTRLPVLMVRPVELLNT